MTAIDKEKLRELIRAFYDLTHIRVAVYNTSFEEILAYPEEYTPFCAMLRENEAACAGCVDSAARMCQTCTATHETIIEKCHMGLTELVAPLYNGVSVIGYIMLGQIASEPDRDAFAHALLKKGEEYGLDREQVLEHMGSIHYYPIDQVLSSARVVNALASYIVVTALVYPTETLLAQAVLEHIARHLGEDVSIAALCREFSISKSTLYRIMEPYAPEGIASYIRRLRLNRACELLVHTDRSLSQIAEAVGYADTGYFLRSFKKELGMSASVYRKQEKCSET
ncbi:MAG: PocR ligand-binding domain-containing protein [Oscillospiraceae bacterium]|nr:PocR ligand-binding domain-containing protein [Oscillospiraceae bacterium]